MPAATASRIDFLSVQGPHGSTFPALKTKADAQKFMLSDEQLAAYRKDGFVHNVSILSTEQVNKLRDGLEDIVKRRNARVSELIGFDPKENSPMTYLQGAWMIDEAIHDLVFHPAITVKLAQLLNTPRVRFWHDQVFYKPAKTGGNVAWHQDYSYWQRSTPSQHITVWIGLDDSRIDNGCLRAVPGSCKWPLLEMPNLMGDMDGLNKYLTPEQLAQFKPVALEQPCGTCSFHHDHTVHGSYPNSSDRPRRAIVLNYMADGTLSAAKDGVLMPGFSPIPAGQKIEGNWFPLVVDLERLK
jgi:hypothetical protein